MHDPDDTVEPLTPDQAERLVTDLIRNATGAGHDVMQLAAAHRDASNRVATLEAENHDLRALLSLRREADAQKALASVRQHAEALHLAARDLQAFGRGDA